MLGITDKRRINSIPIVLYIFFTATIVGEVRFSSIRGTKCSSSGTATLSVFQHVEVLLLGLLNCWNLTIQTDCSLGNAAL